MLKLEIELLRPRCVVCLGVPAAKMLGALPDGLGAWHPWPGYQRLYDSGGATPDGRVGDDQFKAVVVRDPSAVITTDTRCADAGRIASAL